jgi:hypothetical protein
MVSSLEEGEPVIDDEFRLAHGRLRDLLQCYEVRNCTRFPELPVMSTLPQLKNFASEYLEDSQSGWVSSLPLPGKERMSLAHSLFLFRKILPVDTSRQALEQAAVTYVKKMTTGCAPEPNPEFLDFCDREIASIFSPGWDKGYRQRTSGMLFSTSSCLEAGRLVGGARSCQGENGRFISESELTKVRRVAAGWECFPDRDLRSRVTAIKDGCKLRVVSVNSYQQFALKPLHDLIYDHISRLPWLLRGDARPNRFRDFTFREGEVFVSGDYEAATDNISNVVYKHLLSSIGRNSKHVPSTVWEEALARANLDLYVEGTNIRGRQVHGQLMGTFLSFPLLCLLNYLTFKWSVRRDVPVRVNGDDIVFRCTPEEGEKWFSDVSAAGLVVSRGKTLVSKRFFSLNSTMFQAKPSTVSLVPFIRSKCLFNKAEDLPALSGKYKEVCPGFTGRSKAFVQVMYLKRNKDLIWAGQRSVRRGLRMRATIGVLRQAGLLERERWYSSEVSEPTIPAPYGGRFSESPKGFTKVMVRDIPLGQRWEARVAARVYQHHCRMLAQQPRRPPQEAVEPARRDPGSFGYLAYPPPDVLPAPGGGVYLDYARPLFPEDGGVWVSQPSQSPPDRRVAFSDWFISEQVEEAEVSPRTAERIGWRRHVQEGTLVYRPLKKGLKKTFLCLVRGLGGKHFSLNQGVERLKPDYGESLDLPELEGKTGRECMGARRWTKLDL